MCCPQGELIFQSQAFDCPHVGLVTLQCFFNVTEPKQVFCWQWWLKAFWEPISMVKLHTMFKRDWFTLKNSKPQLRQNAFRCPRSVQKFLPAL